MPSNRIPERDPVGYAFAGWLLQIEDQDMLSLAPPDAPEEAHVNTLASGDLIIRYGFRYLGKPHIAIVPGIVALDYGEMLTGIEAWNFIYKKSNLYPRADVVGYRHDGTDEMIPVKMLDLALKPAVLVYADDKATRPIGNVKALIASPEQRQNTTLPPDLLEYIPQYVSITDWQAKQA